MATFGITAATNTVLLDAQRHAQTTFTVTNLTGRPLRGRARVVSQQPAAQSWLSLDGEAERDFPIAGTQQYVVRLAVPPEAPAGSQAFHLDAVSVANPDEEFAQGPTVTYQVAAPVATKPFPWWIVAVIIGMLLVVGLAIGAILYINNNNAQREALAQAATQTALAQMGAANATATAAAEAQAASAAATQTAAAGSASAAATATALAAASADATATALAGPEATASAQASAPVPPLYFASPRGTSPGTIWRLVGGASMPLYTSPTYAVHSLASAPDGSIYFLDANRFEISRYQGGIETLVYVHTTYVRTVRVDSAGRVYFSEATGGGGNGTIYRIDPAGVTPVLTVDLAQVEGYWAGDFTFDRTDNLWLASGNRIPASLYQVAGGVAERVFTHDTASIRGPLFEPGGSILFTDGGTNLYRVTVPLYRQQLLYSFPAGEAVSDLALSPP